MTKAARKKQSFFQSETEEKVKKIEKEEKVQEKEAEISLVESLEQIEGDTAKKRFKFSMKNSRKLIYVLFFVVLGITIGASIFFYMKYDESRKAAQTGDTPQNAKETQKLLDKVGKLIQLPKGETPTVATVTNFEKLVDQPFFRNAKNGDRVIIYGSTQMAYLYRPTDNMLINVAPINVNPEQSPAEPRPLGDTLNSTSPTPEVLITPSVTPTPTKGQEIDVIILNGTTKVGLTKTAEANIKAKNNAITVVDRDNAKSSDYDTTVVIDTGGGKVKADAIAKLVGGKVSALPAAELKPSNADVLVILGTDYK